jgi:hypothetical protein
MIRKSRAKSRLSREKTKRKWRKSKIKKLYVKKIKKRIFGETGASGPYNFFLISMKTMQ